MEKVAVVTGGARGIGEAISARLAKLGFAVAIVDLDPIAGQNAVDKITSEGGTAHFFAFDISDEQAATAGVQKIQQTLGPIQVLVNNAGILRDNSLRNMSVEDWDSVITVHLRGAFLMSKLAQADMVAGGWGRIVNLSSTSATGNRGQANYSAAKAGIQGLTKTLALELGKFGITANAIAPGFIETDMTRATAERVGMDFEEFKKLAADQTAVKRTGKPKDIANAVAFFVAEDSSFVTGQVLFVAGAPHV